MVDAYTEADRGPHGEFSYNVWGRYVERRYVDKRITSDPGDTEETIWSGWEYRLPQQQENQAP